MVVAGDQDPPVRGEAKPCSAPVCGHASGSFDDRNHRAKIVGLEAGFKDEIDKARRRVARRRSNRRQSATSFTAAETRAKAAASGPRNISGVVAKRVAASSPGQGPAADRGAVQCRRPAGRADPALTRDRLVDDAEDRMPAMGQRDQGPEQRHAADKGFRSVDRVQNPDEFGVSRVPGRTPRRRSRDPESCSRSACASPAPRRGRRRSPESGLIYPRPRGAGGNAAGSLLPPRRPIQMRARETCRAPKGARSISRSASKR